MDKQAKIQDIFKRAEEAAKAKKLQETKIEVVEDTTDESPSHSLPVEYVTASGIMVNSKDIMTNTSFLNKLNLNNNAYDDLKFTKEQALKIQTEMARMTAGVISVTPLTCLGPDCMFAKTCIAQGTEILTYSSKNGYKKIEDIVEGDIIYSFNKDTKKIEHDYVEKLSYMGIKETYRITTHTGLTLKCTADHPILTSINDKLIYQSIDEGLGEGSQVYISDTDGTMDDLIDSYGDLLIDVIEDVEYLGKDEVYDITVRNNHNFFANNINVHNCQPFDEVVLTTDGTYIKIEDLDPAIHKLVTYDEKERTLDTEGQSFKKYSRNYSGNLITLKSNNKQYSCTPEHFVSISWNEKAIGKHIVYLMQKGSAFRVGVTTLIQNMKDDRRQFGLTARATTEEADFAWILSVHNTRVEALLNEEYFSIKASAPKSLFISDDASRHATRWNGKNLWVTQEQLDTQFKRLNKHPEFYADFLQSLGLDYNCPFFVKGKRINYKLNVELKIPACNVLDDVMDIVHITQEENGMYTQTIYPVEKNVGYYSGTVYSLDVDKNHNYFTGYGLLTRNCPLQQEKRAPIGKDCWLEVNQIKYWMEKYIEEFQVDGSSLTDLHMISRLCEYDVLEMRATKYLKEHDQALLTDFISSYDEAGNPISNKALSPAFELKERIDRMRSKTLKELMATREAKAKLIDAAKVSNASNNLSALKEQLEQLIKNKAQIIDVTPAKD